MNSRVRRSSLTRMILENTEGAACNSPARFVYVASRQSWQHRLFACVFEGAPQVILTGGPAGSHCSQAQEEHPLAVQHPTFGCMPRVNFARSKSSHKHVHHRGIVEPWFTGLDFLNSRWPSDASANARERDLVSSKKSFHPFARRSFALVRAIARSVLSYANAPSSITAMFAAGLSKQPEGAIHAARMSHMSGMSCEFLPCSIQCPQGVWT